MNNKLKIIQITGYYPPHLGGLEMVVKEISERLAKKGNLVEVFTSNIGYKKEKSRQIKNLKVNYFRSWEFANTPITPCLFFKLLRIPKDSIMHIHIAQAFIPEVAYLVSKIRNIPYITHFHGETLPTGKFGFLLPFYKKIFTKMILSKSEKIICLSKDYKRFINKKYGIDKSKITVIPNGVSEDFFVNKNKPITKIPNLLFVGRLSIDKNVKTLIKAVSLLRNRVVLNIVGEGKMEKKLKNLVLEKGMKNIFLHGRKTGKELINFYKNADIFLLASRFEGQPLTLLEAMASGNVIIASNIMGVREIIGNAGVLVDPPTSENFAMAIDKLIKNRKLISILSKRGIKKAKLNNWDSITKELMNIYWNIKQGKIK